MTTTTTTPPPPDAAASSLGTCAVTTLSADPPLSNPCIFVDSDEESEQSDQSAPSTILYPQEDERSDPESTQPAGPEEARQVASNALQASGGPRRTLLDHWATPEYANRARLNAPPAPNMSRSQARASANDLASQILAASADRQLERDEILAVLRLWAFDRNRSRKNVAPTGVTYVHSDAFGAIADRRGGVNVRSTTLSYPAVPRLLNRWLAESLPDERLPHMHTSIQINKNFASKLHRDKNNLGPSYIISLGVHSGGELQYYEDDNGTYDLDQLQDDPLIIRTVHNISQKMLLCDGKRGHAVLPFAGERFSVVFYAIANVSLLTDEQVTQLQGVGFPYSDVATAQAASEALRPPVGYNIDANMRESLQGKTSLCISADMDLASLGQPANMTPQIFEFDDPDRSPIPCKEGKLLRQPKRQPGNTCDLPGTSPAKVLRTAAILTAHVSANAQATAQSVHRSRAPPERSLTALARAAATSLAQPSASKGQVRATMGLAPSALTQLAVTAVRAVAQTFLPSKAAWATTRRRPTRPRRLPAPAAEYESGPIMRNDDSERGGTVTFNEAADVTIVPPAAHNQSRALVDPVEENTHQELPTPPDPPGANSSARVRAFLTPEDRSALLASWPPAAYLDIDEIQAAVDIPDVVRVGLAQLSPLQPNSIARLGVYPDGSARRDPEAPHSWAFTVIAQHVDGSFALVTVAAGKVSDTLLPEAIDPAGFDRTARSNVAELAGSLASAQWVLQGPFQWAQRPVIDIGPDSMLAIGAASGQQASTAFPLLTTALRSVHLVLQQRLEVYWEHIPGHDWHPWNELSDIVAKWVAQPSCAHEFPGPIAVSQVPLRFLEWEWLKHAAPAICRQYPPVEGIDFVVAVYPADPSFVKSQIRIEPQTSCCAGSPFLLKAKVGFANFLTFGNPGPDTDPSAGKGYGLGRPGRTRALVAQLEAQHYDVVFGAEHRMRRSGIWQVGSFLAIVSAATDGGCNGKLILLSTALVVDEEGKARVLLEERHINVVHADPTRLVVTVRANATRLNLFGGQSPHALSEEERRARWWQRTRQILHASTLHDAQWIWGLDANATLGASQSDAVGPVAPEAENANSSDFHSTLGDFGMFAPSTFFESATGVNKTWRCSRGVLRHRCDYVCLPRQMYDCVQEAGVDTKVDLATQRVDHYLVYVVFSAYSDHAPSLPKWGGIRYDRTKIPLPGPGRTFVETLARGATCEYAVDVHTQCHVLTGNTYDAACAAFPRQRKQRGNIVLSALTSALIDVRATMRGFRYAWRNLLESGAASSFFLAWTRVVPGLSAACSVHPEDWTTPARAVVSGIATVLVTVRTAYTLRMRSLSGTGPAVSLSAVALLVAQLGAGDSMVPPHRVLTRSWTTGLALASRCFSELTILLRLSHAYDDGRCD